MSGTLTGVGNILGNVGSLVGAASDIYGAFQKPSKQPNNSKPFTGLITTPQYSFGGGVLTRRNDDFLSGQRRIRDLLGQSLQAVRPGFGNLTQSGVNAIRQRSAEAAGNLRAQLGRRSLLGASFADDSLTRVGLEYQQAENEFRSQAFQQELAATNELLDREQASLLTQATQELQEFGIAADFLGSVNQVAVGQKELLAQLKEEELMAQYGQQPGAAPGAAPGAPAAATPRPMRPAAATPVRNWRDSVSYA